MGFFSFSKKKKAKSASTEMLAAGTQTAERRRAVRIDAPKVQASLLFGNHEMKPEIEDMSTLGLQAVMPAEPEEAKAVVLFHSPEIVNGLKIAADKRHVRTKEVDGKTIYKIGYEFSFSTVEQQSKLLRWLTTHLMQFQIPQSEEQTEAPEKKNAPSVYYDMKGRMDIRFPANLEDYNEILKLITRLTPHHALLQTKYFLVRDKKNRVIAAMPLFVDTMPFQLIADQLFPDELSSLRSMGRQIGEVSLPYFNEELIGANPASAHLDKLRVLYAVFSYVVAYAKQYAHLTDLITLAPTHLEEFYRIWMFREIGPDAKVLAKGGVTRKGYRLMWLNLHEFYEKIGEVRPEMLESVERFLTNADLLKNFQESFYPDAETIKRVFIQDFPVLKDLSQSQQDYFKSLVPNLF